MAEAVISAIVESLLRKIFKAQLLNDSSSFVESGVIRVVRNQIFDKKDIKENESVAVENLKRGNELCRGRVMPMSPAFITKLQQIYEKCKWKASNVGETPLTLASRLGLAHVVWGFIECSKQTNRNLHTHELGKLQDFLWLRNDNHETALDVAIANNHVEVAKLLLSNASIECLTTEWKSKGKTLLPMLHHPQFDGFVFEMLEKEKTGEIHPLASIPIHNRQGRREYHEVKLESFDSTIRAGVDAQGSTTISSDLIKRVDIKSINDLSRLPSTGRNEAKGSLDKLDHDLLGLNPNNSTILHLASRSGDVNYVKVCVEKDHSKIHCRNSSGETPAYVAAREGHVDILEILINRLKGTNANIKSLLTRSTDQHNALHIALQNHHAGVVFWLIEEFPQLANCINSSNESPLYIAAERKYFVMLEQMLKKCKEISFAGPKGKTALHAAVISNSPECIQYLLNTKRDLLNEKDEKEWTPLLYAVHHNNSLATKELLNADHSIGYQFLKEDGIYTSAIHIAAREGHCETMEELIDKCMGCSEFVDNRGRNILHVAVENNRTKVIEFIFRDQSLTSLINQKDNNGDTPIHLLVASNFETMALVMDYRVDINVVNKDNVTPLDKASSKEQKETLLKGVTMSTSIYNQTYAFFPDITKELEAIEKEWAAKEKKSVTNFKIVDSLVLVVTLIATATFAAAFTVPGGFDSNSGSKQGTPYLLKKSAFQAFVVTNTIAFCSSCSVLLGHIFLLFYRNHYDEADEEEQKFVDTRVMVMYVLTGIALFAMTAAFITGLYVVLTPSRALAIIICVMSAVIMVYSLAPIDVVPMEKTKYQN